jgi:hypothetical protein
VRVPTARAGGISDLQIIVDSRERYAYRFTDQQVFTTKRSLPCGDYGLELDGRLVAAVERKSLPDLVSSLTNGTLRFAIAELASLPLAAVVVEERYSQVYKLDRIRPAVVADGLAELQVRWPGVPIVFCETRPLAEEWTYRYLAAAHAWARSESAAIARIGVESATGGVPAVAEPPTSEVRAWARSVGLPVARQGRLRPEIVQAWSDAHRP